MKFGVCVPNYGPTSSADAISAVALEAESLGYDSVWTTDHLLMPRNSGTPYERVFDCLATLAYLAPQTKKVRLGVSSLIVAMRNPVAVAKQLATIDSFSSGRVLLAIGAGWNGTEFESVGSNFHDRGKRVDESIRLIRSLWSGETAFKSRWLPQRFEDAVFDPRPVSKDLEVWVGGTSDAAMKRACRLGDAWHPNVSPLEEFGALVARFRNVSAAQGSATRICVRVGLDSRAGSAIYTGAQGEPRLRLTGNMDENAAVISGLEEVEVSYAVVVPSAEGRTSARDQLESIRAFAKRFVS
ncbi:MAG: TIGR03619 family F420-dependent LLM class oxidoreductase [Nitrososphaerales archaeon]|jgi:probable F420-dependent oxidoreductase